MDITSAVICVSGVLISLSNLALVFYLTRRTVVDKPRVDISKSMAYTPSKISSGKLRPRAKTDEELHFDEIEENKRKPRY